MSDALEREFVTFAKQLPENMYRKLKEVINVKQKYANVLHYYEYDGYVFVCVQVKICISSHCNKNRRYVYLTMTSIINTQDLRRISSF